MAIYAGEYEWRLDRYKREAAACVSVFGSNDKHESIADCGLRYFRLFEGLVRFFALLVFVFRMQYLRLFGLDVLYVPKECSP